MAAMPVIFFGHGNPMNALGRNAYTENWAAIGRAVERPRAVLMISAHWYLPSVSVTSSPNPRTLHDFGGFPKALFEVEYPVPGSPALAERVQELLAPIPVGQDGQWGLDHGAWSVLLHIFPGADIPVVQLSIDSRQPPLFHYQLGQRLKILREEGVLIAASGNVVHNLGKYAWDNPALDAYDWAQRFEQQVIAEINHGNHQKLIDYTALGADALLSAPTPEHYLPLLYILGASEAGEKASFPVQGFEGGSISMLAVQFG